MNKSEIFKKAHQLAKEWFLNNCGHYLACFKGALKSVYQELKDKSMKTAAEIKRKIDEITKRDAYYNNLNNEGEGGYYNDSVPQSLRQEYADALEREWSLKWTKEYAAKAKEDWNKAAKLVIDSKKYQYQAQALAEIEKITGISREDMSKAKAIFG